MKGKLKDCLTLFLTFLKIGAFTFGGGYAMIPIIEKEMCDKHKWLKGEEILDIFAISESTPGPIAINSATFVGFRVAGTLGSFCATLGVVLPSFIIISLISLVLAEFSSLEPVKYAFVGIRAGVLALVIKAFYSMYKKCPKNLFSYIIMFGAFAASLFIDILGLDISVIYIIISCAVIGLVYSTIQRKRGKEI
jgi:chromate transporter